MLSLLENAKVTGTTRFECEEELNDLDSRTYFTDAYEPSRFTLIHVNENVDGVFNYTEIEPVESVEETRTTKAYPKGDSVFVFGNQPLVNETATHKWLLRLDDQATPYVFGERAMTDLFQLAGIGGRNSNIHSPELVEAVYKILLNEKNIYTATNGKVLDPAIRFMYRIDDEGNRKILSARTAKYAEINQGNIIPLIDQLQGCGTPEITGFEIDNFITDVDVEFPEIAKDYQETFTLQEPVIPGIKVMTSDAGNSAFKVIATLKVGNTANLPIPVLNDKKSHVTKRHIGTILMDRIAERANLEIFGLYKRWPEILSNLALMREEIPVYDGLCEAFHAMKLRSTAPIISEKKENEIITKLCELYGKLKDTPYNIAKLALKAPELDFLSEIQSEFLTKHILNAYTGDYYRIVLENKKGVVA